MNQWNFSVQRELATNMSLEVAYVGNRGVWLEANSLVAMNAIRPGVVQARGLDLRNPADRTLLTSGNPLQTPTYSSQGIPNGGSGYINATQTGRQRNGQLVARFEW